MEVKTASGPREFLKMLLLLELWVGLWVTLKNQFRPHITVEYPKERVELSPRFRGVPRLRFHPENGEELCIACHLCETVCPDNCIHIVSEKKPDGKGKRVVRDQLRALLLLRAVRRSLPDQAAHGHLHVP